MQYTSLDLGYMYIYREREIASYRTARYTVAVYTQRLLYIYIGAWTERGGQIDAPSCISRVGNKLTGMNVPLESKDHLAGCICVYHPVFHHVSWVGSMFTGITLPLASRCHPFGMDLCVPLRGVTWGY